MNFFEKNNSDVEIKYLWNVYVLKMMNLVSLEIMLINNLIGSLGLVEISKGWIGLRDLKWLVFDLSRNWIGEIDFLELIENFGAIE